MVSLPVLFAVVAFQAGGEDGPASAWSGHLEALDDPTSVDLAPDGARVLYLQGAPWPRVAEVELAEPSRVRLLAPTAPASEFPPRYARDGGLVLATLSRELEGIPAERDVSIPLEVVAIDRATLEPRRLHPGAGRAEAFSVLFGVDEARGRALVGTGTGYRGGAVRRADRTLRLVEVEIESGREHDLALEVPGDALVRYAIAGGGIEYTTGGKSTDEVLILPSGATQPVRTGRPRGLVPRRAGAADVTTLPELRFGAFGHDPWRREIARTQSDTIVLARSDGGEGPGRLLSLRGEYAAFGAGPLDAPRLVVGRWRRVETRPQETTALEALPPAWREGEDLATGDPAALRLLEMARAHLRSRDAEVPEAIRATLAQRSLTSGSLLATVRVLEARDGRMRIEHVIPIPGAPGETVELRHVYSRDSVAGDVVLVRPGGGREIVAPEVFAREVSVFSLFRHLLDPAGLGRGAAFGAPEMTPAASTGSGAEGERRWKIPFSHEDGFVGILWLAVGAASSEGARPYAVETPLAFESTAQRDAVADGVTAKAIVYDTWTRAGGWLVPFQLAFVDGRAPFSLHVEEVEWLDAVEAGAFGAE